MPGTQSYDWKLFRRLLPALILTATTNAAFAQTAQGQWDSRFTVRGVDGRVRGLASDEKNLYACGAFVTAGSARANGVARWNGTDWSAFGIGIDGFPGSFGFPTARAIAVLGNNVYVGGSFSSVDGVRASNIARWDGTNWGAVGAELLFGEEGFHVLTVHGNDLYAGGDFSSAGSSQLTGIAKWDGTQWSGFGNGIPGGFGDAVHAIAVDGSTIYAGGQFRISAGVSNIARWTGTAWVQMGQGLNADVTALTFHAGNLYAGGKFTRSGTTFVNHLARWTGLNWSPVGGGINGDVNDLVTAGGSLWAAGSFTQAGTTPATNVASWDGSTWRAVGGGVSGLVEALTASSSNLYVGGFFDSAGGIPSSHLASWDGAAWSALSEPGAGKGLYSTVNTIPGINCYAFLGRDAYVGGRFTSVGGVFASSIARWDGTNWSALAQGVQAGPGGPLVYSICNWSNKLIVAGNFDRAGGLPVPGIAVWDGTQWSTLDNQGLFPIAFSDVKVVANQIYATDGIGHLMKYDGQHWTDIHPYVGCCISRLAEVNGQLYGGGNFPARVVRYDGTTWSEVGPIMSAGDNGVTAMASDGVNLYVGGFFRYFQQSGTNLGINHIAKWDGTNWSALGTGFEPGSIDFAITSIAATRDDVYVSGGRLADGRVIQPARWDGTNWTALASSANGSVTALGFNNGKLYAAGAFQVLGDRPSVNFGIWYPAVQLSIARAQNHTMVSWPTNASDYLLQSTSDLDSSMWEPVPGIPSQVGSLFSVTNGSDNAAQYYRLRAR